MALDLSSFQPGSRNPDEAVPNFCPKCRTEYREGFTVCADCGVPLVHELPPEEKNVQVSDETGTGPEGAGSGDWVTVLEGVNAEDLMVARSVLDATGIPSLVHGRESPEPSRVGHLWTDSSAPLSAGTLRVRREDLNEAREILGVKEDEPGSEVRVEELEHKLVGEVAWFGGLCLAGLAVAYIVVPGDWDQQVRVLIYILAAFCVGFLGSHIRKGLRQSDTLEK